MERAFLPGQQLDLADIAERVREVGVDNPAVVVVGGVVRLSPQHPAPLTAD